MWSVIPSMEWLLQGLSVVFTEPSFQTQCEVLLGWLLCLGRRTEFRVFETRSWQSNPSGVSPDIRLIRSTTSSTDRPGRFRTWHVNWRCRWSCNSM